MKELVLALAVVAVVGGGGLAASDLAATPPPNAYGWNNTSVTVTISGVAPVFWRVNGGPEHSAPSPATFSLATEGVYLIEYRDSTEPDFRRATVRIDLTPPGGAVRVPESGGSYVLNQPLSADWSVWDTLSGIAGVRATADRGGPVDTRSPGQQAFTLRVQDRAGNEAEITSVYFVRGIIAPAFPSGFHLDRVLPPEEVANVGRYPLRARYTVGEEPQFGFLLLDYFGRVFSRAWPEISVVRVQFENGDEKYPLAGWYRVSFDPDRGYYFLVVPSEKLDVGIYDLWVLFGDGQFERIRIEFLPRP